MVLLPQAASARTGRSSSAESVLEAMARGSLASSIGQNRERSLEAVGRVADVRSGVAIDQGREVARDVQAGSRHARERLGAVGGL